MGDVTSDIEPGVLDALAKGEPCMTTGLTVGTATAAPGTRPDGRIVVSYRPGGGELCIGMPVVALNGAIHGNEPVRSR